MFPLYIVTPVLNGEKYLDETVWSVVSQKGDLHIRYHVQDAGSTDGTVAKLRAWSERLKTPGGFFARIDFSFASEPDAGLYDGIAKAFGVMEIPGDAFMAWLGAGDLLWPGALAAIADLAADAPGVDWVMGWPSIFDAWGRVIAHNTGGIFPQSLIAAGLAEARYYRYIQQESTFWKKSLWDKAGGLDRSFRLAGDWDLWRRFARHSPLVHMQRNLGAFRRAPGQLSEDKGRYLAEVNAKIPEDARAYRLRNLMRAKRSLCLPVADIDSDGKWRVSMLECRLGGDGKEVLLTC
jgi:glycosyltransferase involved in cell wall biosynthesis